MATTHDLQTLRKEYEDAGQPHVWTFFDSLDQDAQQAFCRHLGEGVRPARMATIFESATAPTATPAQASSADETMTPPPAESCGSIVSADPETLHQLTLKGLSPISQGKVAVLVLAGGQGTRLGSSDPKGCYDIGLPSHKSLFQLQAERIRRVAELANIKSIPWYVMTSGPTRAATERYFEQHHYFGLKKADVVFFNQNVLPAVTKDGKWILESKTKLALAPDGNGGIYAALRNPSSAPNQRSALDDMQERGIEYVHAYCVDNCLVKVPDPIFLGYCISKNVECGIKVVRKTQPSEPVGVVVQRNGQWAVAEYSEIPQALMEQHDADGKLTFGAANIANHFFTVAFLKRVQTFEDQIPFHVAHKKIPYIDLQTASVVKPSQPNGIKLERFIFDVFPFTPSLAILEVDRREEFSPLKNAPGTGTDDPQTSRRDVLQQHRRWLEKAGASFPNEGNTITTSTNQCDAVEVEVELSPLVTFNGEGLDNVAGKVIGTSAIVDTTAQLTTLR